MRRIMWVLSVMGFFAAGTAAAQESPVVVELYTSQGCSSCPPADALMQELAKRDNVIALALHVDYWDYIGWADSFANPAYSQRQHAYARAAHATTVYTPQMVINGQDHVVGSRPMQVMDLIQAHRARGLPVKITLTRAGEHVSISATPGPQGDYVVQLVRFRPEETVSIGSGENAGRAVTYANIVTGWDVVTRWDGADALALDVEAEGPDPLAVIIQPDGNGPIIGAAQLR